MPRYDASNAECLVFSFKDGFLAKLAHDLKIKVSRFEINVADDRSSVEASFDATSLEVVCRRIDGRDDPGGLNKLELMTIHGNIKDDVLAAKKFPKITFRSTEVVASPDGGAKVKGDLTLHGQTRSISTDVKPEGGRLVTELRLHQPDFGIKPYSAALGALKVQADVVVRLSIPAG
ncbi:MAG: YceI family protein [Polyangiaceae bacterium]|nr:YceI family protein [Polyangiaceae bacterium]